MKHYQACKEAGGCKAKQEKNQQQKQTLKMMEMIKFIDKGVKTSIINNNEQQL